MENETTLQALTLRQSLRHWETNIAATREQIARLQAEGASRRELAHLRGDLEAFHAARRSVSARLAALA